MGVGIMRDETLKRRDLNASHTLGCVGKTYRKTSGGHSAGVTEETWSDAQETKGPECM